MANPLQRDAENEVAKRVAAVPSEVRSAIARAALRSQRVNEHWPYYSRVRFQASVTSPAPPALVYTLTQNQRVLAFSYGQGEQMIQAGFPAGRVATLADTNIVDARKTEDGADIAIHGISAFLLPTSDGALAGALWSEASVVVEKNGGDQRYKLGNLAFMPQSGGLTGSMQTRIVEPDKSMKGRDVSFAANGWQVRQNRWDLPEEILWTPSGHTDSTLSLKVELQQEVSSTATPRVAGTPAEPQDSYDPPTIEGEQGTFVDIMFLLHVRSMQPRSVNR